jgi:predicted type IV restriction endonuclease
MHKNQNAERLDNLYNVFSEEQNKIILALEAVKNEGVSNYPVIICFYSEAYYELGIPLLNKSELAFNISTLEELYVKNIVDIEKVNNFKALYNHKLNHVCVLSVLENNAEFVFIPLSSNFEF